MLRNALTIDLEDYFHVSAFADHINAAEWASLESRLQKNTEKILELLNGNGCRATFFVLGWVAEHYARLVEKIADCGHEIGCHSHEHRLVREMTAEEFREDTRRAKACIEDAIGKPIVGYRAPSFSLSHDPQATFDILAELGFRYDSSLFPVEHPSYGNPRAPRFPFRVKTRHGPMVEFPLTTLELAGRRSPRGGGAYLRLLPYWYTRWAIRYLNHREKLAVCVYLHPWELDPEQPRMKGSLTARVRHYMGLRGTEWKLRGLLRDFKFAPLATLLEELPVAEHTTLLDGWTTVPTAQDPNAQD